MSINAYANATVKDDMRKVEWTPFGKVVFERRNTFDELVRIPIEQDDELNIDMKTFWEPLLQRLKKPETVTFGEKSYEWKMVTPNNAAATEKIPKNAASVQSKQSIWDFFRPSSAAPAAAGGARRTKRSSASRRPTSKPKHSA